jgi:hypothetical protein
MEDRMSRKGLELWEFPLTLLGTGEMESRRSSVRKLKRNEHPLFRG